MAQIKYYIEPTAFDRGFSKAVEHHAEWTNLLIDLGEVEPGKHQCYSIRDGHVEATTDYVGHCLEITLDNYKEVAENHTDRVPSEYLIEGEVVSVFIDSLHFENEVYLEIYDKLPGEVNLSTDLDYHHISNWGGMTRVAELAGFATFEMMDLVVGRCKAILLPKDKVMALQALNESDYKEPIDPHELGIFSEEMDEEIEELDFDGIDLELD